MGRAPRSAVGNIIYHVLNRSNGREKIFRKEMDYDSFLKILGEAKEKFPMRILGFCLMPNHWHFVLHPEKDSDLSRFMHWLTLTHTQRWHAHYKMTGYGHLYQGRYKSFPVQQDEHFITVIRYVERNALRANLVKNAQDWRWGSAWIREYGSREQQKIISSWPIPVPEDYLQFLNTKLSHEEDVLEDIRTSVKRGSPYGDNRWVSQTAKTLGLESTMRPRGRPWPKDT